MMSEPEDEEYEDPLEGMIPDDTGDIWQDVYGDGEYRPVGIINADDDNQGATVMSETPAAWYKQQPADMATQSAVAQAFSMISRAADAYFQEYCPDEHDEIFEASDTVRNFISTTEKELAAALERIAALEAVLERVIIDPSHDITCSVFNWDSEICNCHIADARALLANTVAERGGEGESK